MAENKERMQYLDLKLRIPLSGLPLRRLGQEDIKKIHKLAKELGLFHEINELLKQGGAIEDTKNISEERWIKRQEDEYINEPVPGLKDWREETFMKWVGENKFVLDCGSNAGIPGNYIAEKNKVIGIDLPRVIEAHKDKYKFEYKAVNIEKGLPFPDNYFDVVVAGEIIEHLINLQRFLDETKRILKKNGILIVSTPKGEFIDLTHYRHFTAEILKETLSHNFTIKAIVSGHGLLALAEVKK